MIVQRYDFNTSSLYDVEMDDEKALAFVRWMFEHSKWEEELPLFQRTGRPPIGLDLFARKWRETKRALLESSKPVKSTPPPPANPKGKRATSTAA